MTRSSLRVRIRSATVLALPFLLAAPTPNAHDTWLLAVQAGDHGSLVLSLRTGMDFPNSDNGVDPKRITGTLVLPDGTDFALANWRENPTSKDSQCPLGVLTPGLHVAAVRTEPRLIEMEAKKFNRYLLQDGMPQVLAARMDAGEMAQNAVEQYRKCAKVVFAVGDNGKGPFDQLLGLPLELVPLDNPLQLRPRDTLRVRVLFGGKALEHANVCWDLPGSGEDFDGCTWSDKNGEALVPIARAGWMTVRLVHMTRPRAGDHEWESFWGSLSFEVPAAR